MSKFLTKRILRCPCCETLPKRGFNRDLIDVIEAIAEEYPGIEVKSAYRCKDYNAELNYDDNSEHVKGRAIDLDVPFDVSMDDIATTARINGCTGAIIRHPEQGYIHIDQSPFEIDR